MRDQLLSDILDDVSIAEQMADNPRIKKLLHCYNRTAAINGRIELIDIIEPGKRLKDAVALLSPKSQLRLLAKYHETAKDIEGMEKESKRFELINRIITWILSLITLVVVLAFGLLFLGTFYEKEIPGIDLVRGFLDVLYEIFKLVFSL